MSDLRAWAVEWPRRTRLNGDQRNLVWDPIDRYRLFPTRQECRAYIEREWAFLRTRPDLRAEPYGWRMPRAVRVTVNREVAP